MKKYKKVSMISFDKIYFIDELFLNGLRCYTLYEDKKEYKKSLKFILKGTHYSMIMYGELI